MVTGLGAGGALGGGIVREFGIDRYTLLYLKRMTNKDLLYSTRNSAQHFVTIQLGKEFEKEWICVYV